MSPYKIIALILIPLIILISFGCIMVLSALKALTPKDNKYQIELQRQGNFDNTKFNYANHSGLLLPDTRTGLTNMKEEIKEKLIDQPVLIGLQVNPPPVEEKEIEMISEMPTDVVLPNETTIHDLLSDISPASSSEAKTELIQLLNKSSRTSEEVKILGELIMQTDDLYWTALRRNLSLSHDSSVLLDISQTCEQKENLLNVIQTLVESGIDVNYLDEDGDNVLLLLAVKYKKMDHLPEILRYLKLSGINITHQNNEGDDALLLLCAHYENENLLNIVQFLIASGIDVNVMNKYGENALLLLCKYYHGENLLDIIKLLISSGINVNNKNIAGNNVFRYLCETHGNDDLFDIIEELVENGLQITDGHNGIEALSILCQKYKHDNIVEIIKLLIANGLDITSKNTQVNKLLYYLCSNYNMENNKDIMNVIIPCNDENLKMRQKCRFTVCSDYNPLFVRFQMFFFPHSL